MSKNKTPLSGVFLLETRETRSILPVLFLRLLPHLKSGRSSPDSAVVAELGAAVETEPDSGLSSGVGKAARRSSAGYTTRLHPG